MMGFGQDMRLLCVSAADFVNLFVKRKLGQFNGPS